MTLNELISKASDAYSDGLIATEYWDFEHECPKRNTKGGDTLAQFIANEIADTYDPEASDEQQLEVVLNALSTARGDLEAVSAALVSELETRRMASLLASGKRKEE